MAYADDETTGGWTNSIDTEFPQGFWEELPRPLFWRVLVAPMRPRQISKGGILIAKANQDAQEILNYMGKIVAVGPQAGVHERLGGDGKYAPSKDFPKIGEFVVYGKYAGQQMLYKGVKLIQLNDDELMGVIPNPETLQLSV